MSGLERELHAVGAWVELPAELDLVPSVRTRIAGRRPAPRRALVAVVAALAVAVAIAVAFAVPPARSAILRWLGLKGVRIELVDRLPEVRPDRGLSLGRRVSLDEARRLAGFRLLESDLLGEPDAVYWDGRQVSFVYGNVRLLLSQLEGSQQPVLIKKVVGPGTRVEHVTVNGEDGYLLSGAPHFLYLAPTGVVRTERIRLAADTLLWERDGLTLRLEGRLTADEALELARSLR